MPVNTYLKATQKPPKKIRSSQNMGLQMHRYNFFYPILRKFFLSPLSKPVTKREKTNNINHEKNQFHHFRNTMVITSG